MECDVIHPVLLDTNKHSEIIKLLHWAQDWPYMEKIDGSQSRTFILMDEHINTQTNTTNISGKYDYATVDVLEQFARPYKVCMI